jgi:hypothetical protein
MELEQTWTWALVKVSTVVIINDQAPFKWPIEPFNQNRLVFHLIDPALFPRREKQYWSLLCRYLSSRPVFS